MASSSSGEQATSTFEGGSPIRIGTRASPLAQAQAAETRAKLMAAHALPQEAFEMVVLSTKGDRILDRALSEIGGKGLFTEEIEGGLLDGSIDIAVHSTKDVATRLPDGLEIVAYLEREDARDALIGRAAPTLDALPKGAVIGSASIRRQALLKRIRPDIECVLFRGNVQTRLRKLEGGEVHATLLARAGLERLRMTEVITETLDEERFPPAPGQGAIAIEARENDERVARLIAPLKHARTEIELAVERTFLDALDGSCRTPIAGRAHATDGQVSFHGLVIAPDGQTVHETRRNGTAGDAEAMGRDAGAELRREAGDAFFEQFETR